MTDDINKRPGTDPAAAAGQTPPARSDDDRDEIIIDVNPEDSSDFKVWYNTDLTRKDAEDPEGSTQKLREGIQTILDATTPKTSSGITLSDIMEEDSSLIKLLAALKDMYDSLSELFTTGKATTALKKMQKIWDVMNANEALLPYLTEELKKPEYNECSMSELVQSSRDENGNIIPGSLFDKAIKAAQAAFDADPLRKVTITQTNKIDFPLDKINSTAWKLLEEDTKGQITFNLAKSGSREKIPVYYSINFDDLSSDIKITKRLTPFDRRVYMAISALFNAGNNVITLATIYKHMGYKGKGGGSDFERINNSILKMLGAQISLDNNIESEKYSYSRFVYKGSLLPIETGELYNVQGSLTDAAIHIFREPPLMTFARERKQITTVDLKLLQSPMNKTDSNLLIDDYLLERISKAKHGKSKHCRILYKTLYEHTEIAENPKTDAEKKAKSRAPEKIKKYLDHYQKEEFISRYTVESDGLTIYWK